MRLRQRIWILGAFQSSHLLNRVPRTIFLGQNDAVLYAASLSGTVSVRSQPSLRPFDLAVAIQLLRAPEERYEPLAIALGTSTSAVHRAVARLQLAGLCVPKRRLVETDAFREFLLHGLRFAFPAVIGPARAGIPTAWSHDGVRAMLEPLTAPARSLVWATESGTGHGETIVPLFLNVPAVVTTDAKLHELLAAIDVFRVGNGAIREHLMEGWQRTIFGTNASS